ncbi:HTTM domain-containing protein [Timonella sp. A28]|uniref:HTTM domain-containing protein n=1 Tax=Timonella sp. A28 TaxID=3442640 RepID=UPI003EB93AE2
MKSLAVSARTFWSSTLDWLSTDEKASWGASFLRIVVGITLLTQLVVNFPFRSYLWGPASAWGQELHASSEFPFQRLLFGPTSDLTVMTVAYIVLGIATFAFLVGWHTRIATLCVLVLHTWITFSDGVYLDQSDNFVRFVLLYALFMNTSAHWSFDARRRVRAPHHKFPRTLYAAVKPYAVVVHNAALAAFTAHICMIYVASAMFKIQGSKWQHGTATYYPLQIPHFSPFPELSALASTNSIAIWITSYAAVYLQLFFPFMLLHATLRKVALVGIIGMHLGIAVLMGLPFFSFLMVAGDSLFITSATYAAVDKKTREKYRKIRGRFKREPDFVPQEKTREEHVLT